MEIKDGPYYSMPEDGKRAAARALLDEKAQHLARARAARRAKRKIKARR